jgi:hypothetical protein
MPDYLILISTLGGIAVFGLAGFVAGPVIAALLLVMWELFAEEYTTESPRVAAERSSPGLPGDAAAGAPAVPPAAPASAPAIATAQPHTRRDLP